MKDKRRTSLLFGLLFLLLVAVIVLANLWKDGLTVRHTLVTGNRIVDTNELLQLAQVSPGDRLFEIDLMDVRSNILTHPFVRSVTVERHLPSTISLEVVERVPIALIHRGDMHSIDAEGVILPRSSGLPLLDLPIISGLHTSVPLTIGRPMTDPDVLYALVVLTTARRTSKELYALISEARLRNGGDVVLYATEGGLPILFGRDATARKLVYLEAFWNEVARVEGFQGLQYIDLRFEGQVVVRRAPYGRGRQHSS